LCGERCGGKQCYDGNGAHDSLQVMQGAVT
jgi:hypothetical protein